MNKSYFEASNDLGANAYKTFTKVQLPLSAPGIVSGILMVFMPSVSTFAINDILGSSQYWLFGNEIYFWFQKSLYNIVMIFFQYLIHFYYFCVSIFIMVS